MKNEFSALETTVLARKTTSNCPTIKQLFRFSVGGCAGHKGLVQDYLDYIKTF